MKQQFLLSRTLAALVAGGLGGLSLAASAGLPPVKHMGSVAYVSGGIGADESQAMKAAMPGYPLALEFAGRTHNGNEYLSDVPVSIVDARGATVLKTNALGPYLLVSLKPGRYSITAIYNGKTERRDVTVEPKAHTKALFLWTT